MELSSVSSDWRKLSVSSRMRYKAFLFSLEVTGALVSSLPASEAEEEIVRSCLNFPCQERKEASSCRLRDRRSSLLFREFGGACVLIALFLSGMRYGTYVYVLLLNIGGALSMFSGASPTSSLQSSWD